MVTLKYTKSFVFYTPTSEGLVFRYFLIGFRDPI